ncbi:hypothetical protein PIB30_000755 [Stylosanthes scabra]|uniref:F-box/LRR-repeat protein 15/At3g58940/PEG3-like LRR domain-containing protein n=1 Tax=Stylosanthes scabra TaxID=79078 RepID=A0ABU6Z1A0_9FABA|nr:hypothetical protein [Stylosanthes scabra]
MSIRKWYDQAASENGVEELELCLPLSNGSIRKDIWYELPLCVIEAKSLTKLVLTGGIRVGQEFLNHSMKFSSVKMLSLSRVLFRNEGVIKHLISRCPLIENLTVEHCSVYNHLSIDGPQVDRICHVKSLFLNGLQELKGADVQGIEEVHVDSPNLEKLCYSHFKLGGPLKLNFDSCTKFTCLCIFDLNSATIADEWFIELFSKFPLLESLEICNCSMSKRIEIFSSQVMVLKLHHCSRLMSTLMLQICYCDYRRPIISPRVAYPLEVRDRNELEVRGSNQLEVNVFTNLDCNGFYDFQKFIQNIPQNILASLSLFISESLPLPVYQYLDTLHVSSVPPSIKHLEFRAHSVPIRGVYGPLMNLLLACCFPKTISFRCGGFYALFIKFFYEMLMGSRKGKCYCRSLERKCWWHALKIVNISYSGSFMIDENADFNAVLDASSGMESVTFSLEM